MTQSGNQEPGWLGEIRERTEGNANVFTMSDRKKLLAYVDRLREALRFYGDCENFLFCENQFLEFNDTESTTDITKTSVVGHQARAVLAEIGGE